MTRGGIGPAIACGIACVLGAASAGAQPVSPPDAGLPGRVEIAAGAMWIGRTSFGTADATETAAGGSAFTLFSTASALGAAPAADLRVGVRLTRVLQAEATGSYAAPVLTTTTSADAEHAAVATAADAIKQFTIGGSLVVHVTRWHVGAHASPFVIAGAGYLREVHEGQTLVVAGQTYHAGGGVTCPLLARAHGVVKSAGIRAEACALARSKALALDHRTHVVPIVAASLFVRF